MSQEWFGIPPPVLGLLILFLLVVVIGLIGKGFEKLFRVFDKSVDSIFDRKPRGTSQKSAYIVAAIAFLVLMGFVVIFQPIATFYVFVIATIVVAFVIVQLRKSSKPTSTLTTSRLSRKRSKRVETWRKELSWKGVANEKMITEVFEVPNNSTELGSYRVLSYQWYADYKGAESDWSDTSKCRLEIHAADTGKVLEEKGSGFGPPPSRMGGGGCVTEIRGSVYLTIEITGYEGPWRFYLTAKAFRDSDT